MTNFTFDPDNTLEGGLYGYSPKEAVKLGIELCHRVEEAVGTDGCHGGIWPGNISSVDDCVALGEPYRGSISDIGASAVEFVSPEQFWSGDNSPAADVYSIGVVLYTALNGGVMPFFEDSAEHTPAQRARALQLRMKGAEMEYPKSASRELGDVVLKAVAFKKEERYQTLAELALALDGLSETALAPALIPVMRVKSPEPKAEEKKPGPEKAEDEKSPEPEAGPKADEPKAEKNSGEPKPADAGASQVHNIPRYKVDKDFEEIIPDKPRHPRRIKSQPESVRDDMDAKEFRKSKKPGLSWAPVAVLAVAVIVALVLLLRSCGDKGSVIPDPTPTPDIPKVTDPVVVDTTPTPVPTPEPTPEPTPTATPEPTEKPLEERYSVVIADVTWSRAEELCEQAGGHLATVANEEELNDIISLAVDKGASFVWLGSFRDSDGIWRNVTGEEMSFARWDLNEPSVMDSDGTREDYLLLWFGPVSAQWAYNDMRNDPVSLLPRTFSGKIAYICEFDD